MKVTLNTLALAAQHLHVGARVQYNGTGFYGAARIEKLDLHNDSLGQDSGGNRKVAVLRLIDDNRRFSINMNDLEAGKLSVDALDDNAAIVRNEDYGFYAADGDLYYRAPTSTGHTVIDSSGQWSAARAQAVDSVFKALLNAFK